MATRAAQLPLQISGILPSFRQRIITSPSPIPNIKVRKSYKCSLQQVELSEPERSSRSTIDVQQKMELICEDLLHLFDDQGIDQTAFDERVMFSDPITKYDTMAGYMFNIALLKVLFKPYYQLHWAKQVPKMAATAAQLPLSNSGILRPNFRQRNITTTFPSPYPSQKILRKCKLLKYNERPSKSTVDVQRKVDFLYEDLLLLFYDQRINPMAFDECVRFRDPITKYDTIAGYMTNLAFLKMYFRPHCLLHWSKQSGPYEITLRWTVLMTFVLLPWKPELAFTGISVMGINPETGKFNSHLDTWDSIKDNEYFSLEAVWDVFRQLRMYKTPDFETPKYQILKRAADYEVRKYPEFVVVEAQDDRHSGSASFDSVVTCIFGKNSKATEEIYTTTPLFNKTDNVEEYNNAAIHIVFSHHKDLDKNNSLPDLKQDTVSLQEVSGGIAAALTFSGKPTLDTIRLKETELRDSLIRDGLKPRKGCVFVPYNDPSRRWKFIMRNEVLIWLEDFRLD